MYLTKGLLDAAKSEIKLALSIERSIPFLNAHFNMALVHEAGGEISQPIKGIDLNPSKRTAILAHFVLADLYNRQGKYKESQQHVAKAKELQKLLSN